MTRMTRSTFSRFSLRTAFYGALVLCFTLLACRLELVQETPKLIGMVSIGYQPNANGGLDPDSELIAQVSGLPAGELTYQWRYYDPNDPNGQGKIFYTGQDKKTIKLDEYPEVPVGSRIMVVVFNNENKGAIASAKTDPILDPNAPNPPADFFVDIYGGLPVGSQLTSMVTCQSDPLFDPNFFMYQWLSSKTGDINGEYEAIPGATRPIYLTRAEDSGKYIKLYVFNPGYNKAVESRQILGPVGSSMQIAIPQDSYVIGVGQNIEIEAITLPQGEEVVWSIDTQQGDPVFIVDPSANPVILDGSATQGSDKGKTWTVTATMKNNPGITDTATVEVDELKVTVNPYSTTVKQGGQKTFLAVVDGTTNKAVTWTVSGNVSGSTYIDPSGLLVVDGNQTLTTLTVKATSDVDGITNGTASVKIDPAGGVSYVDINPSTASIAMDGEETFTAFVYPLGQVSQDVTWTLTDVNGNTVTATHTDGFANGQPTSTVAIPTSGMSAGDQLLLRATSDEDQTVSQDALITVVYAPKSMTISPARKIMAPNQAGQTPSQATFTVTVDPPMSNPPELPVEWIISNDPNGTKATVTKIDDSSANLVLTNNAVDGDVIILRAKVATTTVFADATITVQPPTPGDITIGWGNFTDPGNNLLAPGEVSMTGANHLPKAITLSVDGSFAYDRIRWTYYSYPDVVNGDVTTVIVDEQYDPNGSEFVFDSSLYTIFQGTHQVLVELWVNGEAKPWSAYVIIKVSP